MRYGHGATWDERRSLGVGRALSAAVFYSSAMLGCGVAIALSADQVARMAAPLLTPMAGPASGPASQPLQAGIKPGASNAAIIAALEARNGQSVAKSPGAKVQHKLAVKTVRH